MYNLIKLAHRWQYTRQFWINIHFVHKNKLLILKKPHNKTVSDFLILVWLQYRFHGNLQESVDIEVFTFVFIQSNTLARNIFCNSVRCLLPHWPRLACLLWKRAGQVQCMQSQSRFPPPLRQPPPRIGRL